MFTTTSQAQSMNLHYQLTTLKKGNSSITDYFQKFTSLVDTLSAANQPLNNFKLVSFLLAYLGPEYDSFVMSITTRVDLVSLEDLYGNMLAHELWLEQHQLSVDSNLADANMASCSRGKRGGRGDRFSCYGGCGSNFGLYKTNQGRGRGGRGPLNALVSKHICQVCNHTVHTAIRSYHTFDKSYENDSPSAVHAFFIAPSQQSNGQWYPDLGATHHIIFDLANLNIKSDEYTGSKQINKAIPIGGTPK